MTLAGVLYFCCDEQRRNAVRAHPTLNGIDFLEVEDDPSMPLADRQRFLLVTLLKPPAAPLTPDNVRIDGGEAVRDIRVLNVSATDNVLTVEVDKPGDYATYTLRLVATATSDDPPAGYDPLLAGVDFMFKVNCDTDFDCDDVDDCPPKVFKEPVLDYLARDFNSLRQVMLDRVHTLAPDWQEDNVADLMHTLIDLKAYVSDYQHYQLNSINTEAYLFTARSRISVRRHARLVDYHMHDGCSARVWVHIDIDPAITLGVPLPAQTQVMTRVSGKSVTFLADTQPYREALETAPEVFETLHDATLFSEHNVMCFYTWSDDQCILPRGATAATLENHFPNLNPGDVLIFEEVRGAKTGNPADANPNNRFAVRLVSVGLDQDPLTETDITEIRWHPDDALPAPLCLSAVVPAPPEGTELECDGAISVARGNNILADHGRTLPVEDIGQVPASSLAYVTDPARCADGQIDEVPPRFRPTLKQRPVSQPVPYDHTVSASPTAPRSAVSVMQLDPTEALPAISLAHKDDMSGVEWCPQHDLINSAPDKREFVLEVENDGTARIRFGDDENGMRPNTYDPSDPNSEGQFFARYRIGSLTGGNIGADSLAHVVTNQTGIIGVRNLLAGTGGTDPEEIEPVRQNAPQAFRTQERAVTPADYEARALLYPGSGVQRAAATIRWTGSWYTVFLTVDRLGGADITDEFERDFRAYMDAYRMMGYDLEVDAPQYVPLDIEMEVCVEPDYFRSQVRDALLDVFNTRVQSDGTKGVFHPDNFTFGQTVYLSPLYAAAARIPGVQSLTITRFEVQDQPARSGLLSGKIELGRLEIAQVENDRSFPKRGVFHLVMEGGK